MKVPSLQCQQNAAPCTVVEPVGYILHCRDSSRQLARLRVDRRLGIRGALVQSSSILPIVSS